MNLLQIQDGRGPDRGARGLQEEGHGGAHHREREEAEAGRWGHLQESLPKLLEQAGEEAVEEQVWHGRLAIQIRSFGWVQIYNSVCKSLENCA